MAFKRSENLSRFVELAFADQETRTVWQEWAEGPNAEGEEDLESEWETPGDVAGSEGEA